MGLFKEHACACCGKKTNMMTRSKLKDGNYVCFDCKPLIPNYVLNCLNEYDLEDFHELKKYVVHSDTVLRAKFKQTHSFHSIHLDANNGLFYIDGGALDKKLYLKAEEVFTLTLSFEPEKYKEGVFTEKVKGKITMTLDVLNPSFRYETVIATGVWANAHMKGLLSKKIIYDNPKGMDEFLEVFKQVSDKFQTNKDHSR